MEKRIGKIQHVRFGFGGYQDAQFGLSLDFGSDKECWGCATFDGFWSMEPSKDARWDAIDQDAGFSKTARNLINTLNDAKQSDVYALKGTPVEVTFEGGVMKEWRVLTEAI